jgi:hypothetical protein
LSCLATSDEVHNFDPVAFIENRLRPLGATDHMLVQFDRYSLRRERQLSNQLAQRKSVRDFPSLTVD